LVRKLSEIIMLKIIRKLFRIGKSEEKIAEKRNFKRNIIEPDFIDYDGMGNQGRFPAKESK